MQNRYVDYCKYLVLGLCQESSNLSVVKSVDEQGVLLMINGVAKDDMRNVIGRAGAHVNAIRLLVKSAGMAEGARVSIKIQEPL